MKEKSQNMFVYYIYIIIPLLTFILINVSVVVIAFRRTAETLPMLPWCLHCRHTETS